MPYKIIKPVANKDDFFHKFKYEKDSNNFFEIIENIDKDISKLEDNNFTNNLRSEIIEIL